MAITAYTGPPGSGKSHALVKDVILSAILAGRRVLSNVDGLNSNALQAYCLERPNKWNVEAADRLGEVITFHGEDARVAGFWPDEQTQAEGRQTFVQPGDLVVFDEWAMFFPAGEKLQDGCNIEAFMRWHRHLTHPLTGAATDLCIATQSISDLHRRIRPLLTRSYLFKNLGAVGRKGSYTWHVYDGRLQRHSYQTGHGDYDKSVFPLYSSSAAATAGNHTELRTNRKETIWSGWAAWAAILAPILLLLGGVWGLYRSWHAHSAPVQAEQAEGGPGAAPGARRGPLPPPPVSPWHIIGHVSTDTGTRVFLANGDGAIRSVGPDGFNFDNTGRPLTGVIDGMAVQAVETIPPPQQQFDFSGVQQQ